MNSELSFWQEEPGDWRIRLRGQPARTDVSLNLADTGIVRMEARVKQSAELRQMPIHMDVEWREAQLGQLARLVTGADPGWRGDLTGELHLDGTADAAQVKTRLRATAVHRAEFAPASPLDFDASCGFSYAFSERRLDNLVCESPFGNGRIRVTGALPGNGAAPHLTMELDGISAETGLDALRTVRSNFSPGLEASGVISGKFSYTGKTEGTSTALARPGAEGAGAAAAETRKARQQRQRQARAAAKLGPVGAATALTGNLTVSGLQLSGGGLATPILADKMVLEPEADAAIDPKPASAAGPPATALVTTVVVPLGAAEPLTVAAKLTAAGYSLAVHGQASVARARELGRLGGIAIGPELEAAAQEPIAIELAADGPWMLAPGDAAVGGSAQTAAAGGLAAAGQMPGAESAADAQTDHFAATATLHQAIWKADYLAGPVKIDEATLHMGNGILHWDPVAFSYGALTGTASFTLGQNCLGTACVPQFDVHFKDLDANVMQATVMGAREPRDLLTTLLARLRSASSSTAAATPAWPTMEGSVEADSLALGPVNLTGVAARIHIVATGAQITDFTAGLLSGQIHATGEMLNPAGVELEPSYTLDCEFEKISPVDLSRMLKMHWTGGTIDAKGKLSLSGLTGIELEASAKGAFHFEWRRGSVEAPLEGEPVADATPAALKQFDRWSGDAEIGGRTILLKDNQVVLGTRKRSVDAVVTMGDPLKVVLMNPLPAKAER